LNLYTSLFHRLGKKNRNIQANKQEEIEKKHKSNTYLTVNRLMLMLLVYVKQQPVFSWQLLSNAKHPGCILLIWTSGGLYELTGLLLYSHTVLFVIT